MKVEEAEAMRDGFKEGTSTSGADTDFLKEYLLAEILLQLQQIALIIKLSRNY